MGVLSFGVDEKHGDDPGLSGLCGGLGCDPVGGGFCLHAQDIPGDIGAEVFTADNAAGRSLDQWAPLGRDPPLPGLPLTHQRRRDTEFFREFGLSAGL